jgi:hypothetical protein
VHYKHGKMYVETRRPQDFQTFVLNIKRIKLYPRGYVKDQYERLEDMFIISLILEGMTSLVPEATVETTRTICR